MRIQIFQLAGDHGVFAGKHFLRCMIVDGAAQLEGGAVRGVSVTHGGKAAEGIAPSRPTLNAQRAIRIRAGDLDSVNACQNAPCAGPALPKLHDLIVDRGRSCDGFPGHCGRQVVLHLDGIRGSVGRFLHKRCAFQTERCGMCDFFLIVTDSVIIRDELAVGLLLAGAVRCRSRSGREDAGLPVQRHTDIVVL